MSESNNDSWRVQCLLNAVMAAAAVAALSGVDPAQLFVKGYIIFALLLSPLALAGTVFVLSGKVYDKWYVCTSHLSDFAILLAAVDTGNTGYVAGAIFQWFVSYLCMEVRKAKFNEKNEKQKEETV